MRDYWADDDLWRYFEIDDEGFVRRQVELEGPDREANTACSLEEWEAALHAGTIDQYSETYGMVDEWNFARGDHDDPQPCGKAEFENVWEQARRACAAGSRSRPNQAP
ncbi:hypothetical protein ACSNOI_30050 [Actinomadura kijaniata]|uniref:hypothetical protein n=1 Tax=Actinomadura kijaniata TaxID=46161 RepID=UPI003F1D4D99